MSLNEEQRAAAEEMVQYYVNDPEFMADVAKRTDQAIDTIFDMMLSGVPLEDSLEVMKNAIRNNVIED